MLVAIEERRPMPAWVTEDNPSSLLSYPRGDVLRTAGVIIAVFSDGNPELLLCGSWSNEGGVLLSVQLFCLSNGLSS